ncbi:MAG: glycosyltransferase [Proteobacteria bacterium]|nr:glycosyltransferase [Pseudomonadota bacterium]
MHCGAALARPTHLNFFIVGNGEVLHDAQLRAALGYQRFRNTPRVLVFDTGYLTVGDVLDGASDLGWHIIALKTKSKGKAQGNFVAEVLKAMVVNQPDFILTINHLGFDDQGILAELLGRYEIPIASWFVDHPLPILGGAGGNATPFVQVFCFERTALNWIGEQGYSDPVYLPTGSNRRHFHPDRIDPARAAELASPLTFVGNSWWIKARVEPSGSVKKAAKTLRKQIEVDRHAMANGFHKKLLQADIKIKDPRGRWAAAQVALAEASMNTRGRFARSLKPVGLRVYGDPYWERLAPGLDLRPGIDYETSLPALFSGSSVNANVTAEQMPTALNQRVWDVPGAGGFLLTDAQEDAFQFFEEEKDIVVYRSFEEAASKARYYLAHPTAAKEISERAFTKIDKYHRITNRLEKISQVMRARFG